MNKYVMIVFSLFVLISNAANAQGKKGKKTKLDIKMESIVADLNLNDDVKTKLLDLIEKQEGEKKEIRKNNDKKSDAFKTKMKALQKDQNVQLKAVLGKDKFKEFKKLLKEYKNKSKE
ncbi:hypothetical protein [Polaribacter sp. Hel_I_88]|uniref:hypothetical protein n=1 Tax=Polaribacter sp. Hel_I_88 TaxID=1250006 RepID=UPI00047A15AD|nr:hypothetical protein [Polaribacter sp. Hel_I_88]